MKRMLLMDGRDGDKQPETPYVLISCNFSKPELWSTFLELNSESEGIKVKIIQDQIKIGKQIIKKQWEMVSVEMERNQSFALYVSM